MSDHPQHRWTVVRESTSRSAPDDIGPPFQSTRIAPVVPVGGRVALLALLLVVSPARAADGGAASEIPPDQRFLFEVAIGGAGFSREMQGVYVDATGGVYRYDRSDSDWQPAQDSDQKGYSEADLARKFANSRRIATVDAATLQRMYELIAPASAGSLSQPVVKSWDGGTTRYTAFAYDANSKHYAAVLLYQAGDSVMKNQSDSARTLYEWLFGFQGPPADAPTTLRWFVEGTPRTVGEGAPAEDR